MFGNKAHKKTFHLKIIQQMVFLWNLLKLYIFGKQLIQPASESLKNIFGSSYLLLKLCAYIK